MYYLKGCFILCCIFITTPAESTTRLSWDKLSYNSPNYFPVPLTKEEAQAAGYEQIDDPKQCSYFVFEGFRFVVPSSCSNDVFIIAMYGADGHISGIQTSFLDSSVKAKYRSWYRKQHMLVQEIIVVGGTPYFVYTFTTYLYSPDNVCSSGRSAEDIKANPVGEDFYVMNGSRILKFPLQQSDVNSTNMTLGKCVDGIGTHCFAGKFNSVTDCNSTQPVMAAYNNGSLNVIATIVPGTFKSCYGENLNSTTLSNYMYDVPTCMKPSGEFSEWTAVHFFTTDKEKLKCNSA